MKRYSQNIYVVRKVRGMDKISKITEFRWNRNRNKCRMLKVRFIGKLKQPHLRCPRFTMPLVYYNNNFHAFKTIKTRNGATFLYCTGIDIDSFFLVSSVSRQQQSSSTPASKGLGINTRAIPDSMFHLPRELQIQAQKLIRQHCPLLPNEPMQARTHPFGTNPRRPRQPYALELRFFHANRNP